MEPAYLLRRSAHRKSMHRVSVLAGRGSSRPHIHNFVKETVEPLHTGFSLH